MLLWRRCGGGHVSQHLTIALVKQINFDQTVHQIHAWIMWIEFF